MTFPYSRTPRSFAALALVLALAACGGGSDAPDPSGPPPGPTPGPGPTTPVWGDRIDPFDPAVRAAAKQAAHPLVQAPQRQAVAGARAVPTVALGPLVATPLDKNLSEAADAPLQIGLPRSVADTATAGDTAALLRWQPTARGTQVAAVRFASEGARGVRLGVLVQALPPGAVLRAYGTPGGDVVEMDAPTLAALAARNAAGGADDTTAGTWWTPDFGGPQTTLEVEIAAADATGSVRLSVPRLSHFTHTPEEAQQQAALAKAAGGCNLDLACRPEYLEQGRSVARMVYVGEDGKGYLCTGTLMNDAAASGTPYFLSAHHCVSSQAAASSLTTEWFVRSAACGSPEAAPAATRLTGGATLLYAAARTDVSFMRLNDAPPAGIVYAGSYFGSALPTGTPLAAVHHPQGDRQKVSLGTLVRYSACTEGRCSTTNPDEATFLTLNWQSGVVEQGSSGSAAFATLGAHRYVVGQLLGGTSSCSVPTGVDYYGRFDVSYREALQRWLNPSR